MTITPPTLDEIVIAKLDDMATPGAIIMFDPDEAHHLGAFEETALSLDEAMDAMDGEEA